MVAAAVMIGAGGGMLMSFECSDAVGFIPEPTNDLGVWQSGDENISSPGSTYSSAFFNVTEQYLPDNTTFYITAGSTVTITNLFDSTGTLLDGFADEGGYNSGTGVWNKITRTFENGDGTFTFEWNSATASGPTITIVVVDTEFTPELGTSENPYTAGTYQISAQLQDLERWLVVGEYIEITLNFSSMMGRPAVLVNEIGFEVESDGNSITVKGTATGPGDLTFTTDGSSEFTFHAVVDGSFTELTFVSNPVEDGVIEYVM